MYAFSLSRIGRFLLRENGGKKLITDKFLMEKNLRNFSSTNAAVVCLKKQMNGGDFKGAVFSCSSAAALKNTNFFKNINFFTNCFVLNKCNDNYIQQRIRLQRYCSINNNYYNNKSSFIKSKKCSFKEYNADRKNISYVSSSFSSTSRSSILCNQHKLYNNYNNNSNNKLINSKNNTDRLLQLVRNYSSVDNADNTNPVDTFSSSSSSNNSANNSIEKIRNVAIIAHVDHGKTTLVDKLLKEGGEEIKEERLMDNNVLEKERGITILSKVTRIHWNGYTLNIIDTPGHSDFGGEVERILSLVDGFCLVVDVVEGPKTQTKFVLQKALQNERCKGIVVINKVDRESDRKQGDCENEIFDLFLNFDANENQMDYQTLYASAKNGWVCKLWEEIKNAEHPEGMQPLLQAIVDVIPPPEDKTQMYVEMMEKNKVKEKDKTKENENVIPFALLVTMVEYVDGVGVTVTGKIHSGTVKKADTFFVKSADGKVRGQTVIKHINVTKGCRREAKSEGYVGDIVSLVTHRGVYPNVTDTLCIPSHFPSIKSNPIDPPVICVVISPNTSPLAGNDGTQLTLQAIGKRLKKEGLTNVGIEVIESEKKDSYEVRGRGELQIGILVETLRREGFEMTVSPPTVVYKKDENNKVLEPWEKFTIEIQTEICAAVIEKMSIRNADILEMKPTNDTLTQLVFKCSSRNFLGMRTYLRDISKGTAVVMSEFNGYRQKNNQKIFDRNGVIISSTPGVTTAFSLDPIQGKGILFLGEGVPTYSGMIIGEHYSANDIEMNAVRIKPVQHLRQKGSEEIIRISYKPMNIESCLGYINEDEQIEVTPKRVCMRKKFLSSEERKAASRANFIKN